MSVRPTPALAAAGAAHEEQGAGRPHPGCPVAGDGECHHDALVDVAPRRLEVHVGQGRVVRAASGDHDVVDGPGQILEELFEAR